MVVGQYPLLDITLVSPVTQIDRLLANSLKVLLANHTASL